MLRSGTDLSPTAIVPAWYCDPEYATDPPGPSILPEQVDPGRLYVFLDTPADVAPGDVFPASLAMTVIDGELVIIDNAFVSCFRYEPGL